MRMSCSNHSSLIVYNGRLIIWGQVTEVGLPENTLGPTRCGRREAAAAIHAKPVGRPPANW
jgi:hypothetical protein